MRANDELAALLESGEEAVWRLAAALAGSVTPVEVADASTREGRAATGACLTTMAIIENDSLLVRLTHQSDDVPSDALPRNRFEIAEEIPACAAIRHGLPVLLGSPLEILSRYPDVADELASAGLSALAAVPMYAAGGAALGALGFAWSTAQEFGAAQLRRLDLVAQLTGLALERSLGLPTEMGSEGRLQQAFETMPKAFVSLDETLRVTFVNRECERLVRLPSHEIVGRILFDVVPGMNHGQIQSRSREAIASGRAVTFEEHFASLDAWYEIQAWPSRSGLNIFFSDISEQRRLELRQAAALDDAQVANTRLSMLADLSVSLTEVRTRADVFGLLMHAVVPHLATWCTLVVPDGDALVRVAAFHEDPALNGLAERLIGKYPHRFDGPSPGVVAYRSGSTLQRDRLAQSIIANLDDSATSAAYGRTLLLLGDGPGLIVPILDHDAVVAVLTMVRVEGGPFSEADLDFINQVVDRASKALRAVVHIEAQRETASALQAAALPQSFPEVGTIELAARYRVASEGSQVGGDWYDAFLRQDGRLVLVVGDAAGHGVQAAAVMAQLRNSLRAHLLESASLTESLTMVSRLLSTQLPEDFATVVCAEIEPDTGHVKWASAGHPAPIVVRSDGTSTYLDGRPSPPIGCPAPLTGAVIPEHHFVLDPGDRLLMFTDGLFERRGVHPDIGLAHLMILAEQTLAQSEPDQACDAILEGMLAKSHEDDVCMLIADYGTRPGPDQATACNPRSAPGISWNEASGSRRTRFRAGRPGQ